MRKRPLYRVWIKHDNCMYMIYAGRSLSQAIRLAKEQNCQKAGCKCGGPIIRRDDAKLINWQAARIDLSNLNEVTHWEALDDDRTGI